MAQNSLFAMLLRSRWWASFLIAAATAMLARLLLPKDYEPLAIFSAIRLASSAPSPPGGSSSSQAPRE